MLKVEPEISLLNNDRQSIDIAPAATTSQIMTSETVSAVGVFAIQRLAENLSPDRIFPAIRACLETEVDLVLEILRTKEPEQKLIDAIIAIGSCLDEPSLELLRDHGIELNLSGHQGTAVADAFLKNNDRFSKAYLRKLGSESLLGRTYHFYSSSHVLQGSIPTSISEEQLQKARAKCFTQFEKRGYGPTYSVTPYMNEAKIGLIVAHGTPRGGQTKIDQQENRLVRCDRSERTDVVFFDYETRMLWISAMRGDVAFYAELIAEVLFGTLRFDIPKTFNLSFAMTINLHEQLLRAAGTAAKQVRMQKRIIQMPTRTIVETPKSRGRCLSETHAVDEETRNDGTVLYVKLAVVPKSEKRVAAGIIEIKDNSLVLPENIEEALVRATLRDLGILVPYGN